MGELPLSERELVIVREMIANHLYYQRRLSEYGRLWRVTIAAVASMSALAVLAAAIAELVRLA